MRSLLGWWFVLFAAVGLRAQEIAPPRSLPVVRRALAIEATGRSGRSAVLTDAVLAALARGEALAPRAGESLALPGGEVRTWRDVTLGTDGGLELSLRGGGWCWIEFEHDRDETLWLEAPGCSFVYVGGEPRMADMYALGNMRTPVALTKGSNVVLARVVRGRPRWSWSHPSAPVALDLSDLTMPDLLFGALDQPAGAAPEIAEGSTQYHGALVLSNATTQRIEGLKLATRVDGAAWNVDAGTVTLLPLETRKVRVDFEAAVSKQTVGRLEIEVRDPAGQRLHGVELTLAVRSARATHRRTFVSDIDGSVQYYGLVPSTAGVDDATPGLILSLHGASVEAIGQANAYAAKPWAHIVAPTNRRPYGFDWEDWGRLDALEVLAQAQTRLRFEPRRVYLTGHSMGGHGTWNLGALRSDLFAAIAPSAGWIDFWRYTGGEESEPVDAIDALLRRAANSSRTLLVARNLAQRGVYVLHGDADDNVPVAQARAMREELAKFHPDFAYYERPGAGHWWGNECVDWPALMEFLRERALPEVSQRVAFTTVDLELRDREQWLVVEGTSRRMMPATVSAEFDAKGGMRVSTENVSHLALELATSAGPEAPLVWRIPELGALANLSVEIDGQTLAPVSLPPIASAKPEDLGLRRRVVRFARDAAGLWAPAVDAPPRPSVTFKAALRSRFELVYATGGTPEENTWARTKARFDAEQFRYRGNASPRLLSDVEWLAEWTARTRDPQKQPFHRTANVVLYGNADTHRAWSRLVPEDTVEVRRGFVRLGERTLTGEDLAVLAVQPMRRESAGTGASPTDPPRVAIVAGSGAVGLRTTMHLPYFVSGAGFPDWLVTRAALLENGLTGIEGAGFFDAHGGLGLSAESAWRTP